MAYIVEAPNELYSIQNEVENVKIFMAGGITNCPNWQREFISCFEGYDYVTLFNPRRYDFNITDSNISEKQIVWEHRHLEEADIIIYWFSRGSLNPIVLYELGKYISSGKHIFIGIDDEYERKFDVETQAKLMNYNLEFFASVENLAEAVKEIILQN